MATTGESTSVADDIMVVPTEAERTRKRNERRHQEILPSRHQAVRQASTVKMQDTLRRAALKNAAMQASAGAESSTYAMSGDVMVTTPHESAPLPTTWEWLMGLPWATWATQAAVYAIGFTLAVVVWRYVGRLLESSTDHAAALVSRGAMELDALARSAGAEGIPISTWQSLHDHAAPADFMACRNAVAQFATSSGGI